MYKLIETTNNNKTIFTGSYQECLGKFQRLSPFSFSNHKNYSYTNYNIIEINKL